MSACRRCSNYIFILDLTPGFNWLGKDKEYAHGLVVCCFVWDDKDASLGFCVCFVLGNDS